MLTVKGIKDQKDVKLIKQFTKYCLSRFLTTSQLSRINVEISYLDRDEIPPEEMQDLSKYEAWMVPSTDSNRHFFITIAKFAINQNAKCLLTKYKKTLKYLAHELVHVKQYYRREMKDLYKGESIVSTLWHGVEYPEPSPRLRAANPHKAEWAYYESPWEVEAYGRVDGLYNMFHDEHGDKWRERF